MKSQLFDRYQNEIRPELMKTLGIKNPMQIPRIEKIIVNAGIGSHLQKLGSKDTSEIEENLKKITGRKPIVQRAKQSVSNFKLREGMPVGVLATLRRGEAYNFLDKLVHIVFPRVRDFRGVKKTIFDRDGNASVGFNDFTVFPEVEIPEDSRKIHGLQVTIVISGGCPTRSKALLDAFGFPFKK